MKILHSKGAASLQQLLGLASATPAISVD